MLTFCLAVDTKATVSFSTKSLKTLVSVEEMGVWFNKVVQDEEPKTHTLGLTTLWPQKSSLRVFANQITTDSEHLHLMDSTRSYYAIAAKAFEKGFFKSEAANAAFALYSPPSCSQNRRNPFSRLPSCTREIRAGVPFPTGSSTGSPLPPPIGSTPAAPPPKGSIATSPMSASTSPAHLEVCFRYAPT